MTLRFHNGRIALPDGIVEAADIRVTDGRITAIDAPTALAAGDAIELSGGWLLPGFVDTQVNGGGGDRQSVVKGKSVSVRVDIGGRGLLTNKKTQTAAVK